MRYMNDAIAYGCPYVISIAYFILFRLDIKLVATRASTNRMDVIGIPERATDYAPSQGLGQTHCLLSQVLLNHWPLTVLERWYCGKETGCRIMQRTSCLTQK